MKVGSSWLVTLLVGSRSILELTCRDLSISRQPTVLIGLLQYIKTVVTSTRSLSHMATPIPSLPFLFFLFFLRNGHFQDSMSLLSAPHGVPRGLASDDSADHQGQPLGCDGRDGPKGPKTPKASKGTTMYSITN